MLGSPEPRRAWVLSTLAGLATDEEHHARLRGTLLRASRWLGSSVPQPTMTMIPGRVWYREGWR